jgi:hypothetical protein
MRHSLGLFLAAGIFAAMLSSAVAQPASRLFDSSMLNLSSTAVQKTIRSADLVFAGRVKSVGAPPKFWSGWAVSRQVVTYEVDHVISGQYPGPKGNLERPVITVQHLVVAQSNNATPATALSARVFAKSRMLIVSVKKEGDVWVDFDENFSAIPFSSKNEAAVKKLL